jgi:hypothetical protein
MAFNEQKDANIEARSEIPEPRDWLVAIINTGTFKQ